MKTFLRHLLALTVGFAGLVGVLALLIAMNGEKPEKEDNGPSESVAMDVKPKKRKQTKKPKPKRQKQKKAKPKRTQAPPPQLSGSLGGVDLGLPGFGGSSLAGAANSLFSESGMNDRVVMNASSADKPPKPSAGNPAPKYPARAARMGVTGTVVLKVLVGQQGQPLRVKVVKSDPAGVFEQVALEAVKRWRFEPAVYNGSPVKTWAKLPIHFRKQG